MSFSSNGNCTLETTSDLVRAVINDEYYLVGFSLVIAFSVFYVGLLYILTEKKTFKNSVNVSQHVFINTYDPKDSQAIKEIYNREVNEMINFSYCSNLDSSLVIAAFDEGSTCLSDHIQESVNFTPDNINMIKELYGIPDSVTNLDLIFSNDDLQDLTKIINSISGATNKPLLLYQVWMVLRDIQRENSKSDFRCVIQTEVAGDIESYDVLNCLVGEHKKDDPLVVKLLENDELIAPRTSKQGGDGLFVVLEPKRVVEVKVDWFKIMVTGKLKVDFEVVAKFMLEGPAIMLLPLVAIVTCTRPSNTMHILAVLISVAAVMNTILSIIGVYHPLDYYRRLIHIPVVINYVVTYLVVALLGFSTLRMDVLLLLTFTIPQLVQTRIREWSSKYLAYHGGTETIRTYIHDELLSYLTVLDTTIPILISIIGNPAMLE